MLYGSEIMIFGMQSERIHKWSRDHTRLKMAWIHYQIQQNDGYLNYPPPFLPSSSSSPYPEALHNKDSPSSSGARISPAVLFIIVILAVLFFVSGLLHLLVRFLIKNQSSSESAQSNRHHQEVSISDTIQRQLQQLFHLHDSGLDQAFIDALPVFQYKEIKGLKEPFDCAVCLCEFSEKDKLRLLPMCSHAFHINCIDTWLLSNSTCPLCRGTLFTPGGFSIENPMFDFDDLREDEGCPCNNGENGFIVRQKTVEIEEETVENGIFPVRLGKFRRLDMEAEHSGGGEASSSNLDARRCYSMGSYHYVLGNSDLLITLNNNDRQCQDSKLTKGMENLEEVSVEGDMEAKKITSVSKGESYSVSKIWLWSKKGKFSVSSDAQMGLPSSLNLDLPWMREREGM